MGRHNHPGIRQNIVTSRQEQTAAVLGGDAVHFAFLDPPHIYDSSGLLAFRPQNLISNLHVLNFFLRTVAH